MSADWPFNLENSIYSAIEDVKPSRSFVVYPGTERFRIAPNIEAIGLPDLCDELISQAR